MILLLNSWQILWVMKFDKGYYVKKSEISMNYFHLFDKDDDQVISGSFSWIVENCVKLGLL